MKKIFFLVLFLVIFVSCSSNKQKADDLYNLCLTTKAVTDFSESEKSLNRLEKAIELNSEEWKYYFQKIRIYKYRIVKSETEDEKNTNIINIISVYDEWVENNNTLNSSMEFGLGCAYFAVKEKETGIRLLQNCYRRVLNKEIKEQMETNHIEGLLSGIILKQITEDEITQILISEQLNSYSDFLLQELQ